jgi:hypothetical protein
MDLSPLLEEYSEEWSKIAQKELKRLKYLCEQILERRIELDTSCYWKGKFTTRSDFKLNPSFVKVTRLYPHKNSFSYYINVFFILDKQEKIFDEILISLDSAWNVEKRKELDEIIEDFGIEEYASFFNVIMRGKKISKIDSFIMYQDGRIENNFI